MAQIDIPVNASTRAALAGIREMTTAVGQLRTAIQGLTQQLNNNGAGAARAGRQARGAASDFQAAGSSVRKLSGELNGLRTALIGIGIVQLGKDIVETTTKFNGLQRSLAQIKGDAGLGEAAFKRLDDIANRVGFRTLDLSKSFIQLNAAVQGTTLQGEPAYKMFETLAKATALYGGDTNDLAGALIAVQQITSKGKIQLEELQGQLGDRLPGALKTLAAGMGITTAKLLEMSQKGKLGATDLYNSFAKGFGDKLNGDVQTSTAEFARFQNQLDKLKIAFGNAGFLQGLTQGMKALGAELSKPETVSAVRELGAEVGNLFKYLAQNLPTVISVAKALAGLLIASTIASALSSLAGFVGTFVVGLIRLSSGIAAVTRAVLVAVPALRALGLAFATTPLGAFIALLGLAAGAYFLFARNTDTATVAQKKAKEATDNSKKATAELHALLGNPNATRSAIEQSIALAKQRIKEAQAARTAMIAELQRQRAIAQQEQKSFQDRLRYSTRDSGDLYAIQRVNNANARVDQSEQRVRNLDQQIAAGNREIAAGEAKLKDLKPPKLDVGTINPDSTTDKPDKKTKEQREAEQAAKRYAEALQEMRDAIYKAGLSERDAAAFTALRAAGLKTNLQATDAQTRAVKELAYAQYDAEKRRDDMKQAKEDEIDATNRLKDAQSELQGVTQSGVAQYQRAIDQANAEYAATMKKVEAMNLEADVRARLIALATQTRDTRVETANAGRDQYVANTRRDLDRQAQDTALDRQGLGAGAIDPRQLELQRQTVEIERQREDALRELGENLDKNSQDYIDLAGRINQNANDQKEFLQKQLEQAKTVEQINQLSDFFENLFTKPKETMKSFFTDLLKMMLKTIAYSLIMKKSLGDSFGSLFGDGSGGGLAGGILGSLFGKGGGGFLSKLFGGFFANGGDLPKNKFSVVGERGPELIYNKGANTVIPNNRAFGSGGRNVNFSMGNTTVVLNNSNGMSAQDVGIHVAKEQERRMRSMIREEMRNNK